MLKFQRNNYPVMDLIQSSESTFKALLSRGKKPSSSTLGGGLRLGGGDGNSLLCYFKTPGCCFCQPGGRRSLPAPFRWADCAAGPRGHELSRAAHHSWGSGGSCGHCTTTRQLRWPLKNGKKTWRYPSKNQCADCWYLPWGNVFFGDFSGGCCWLVCLKTAEGLQIYDLGE